jgi:lipopolysaccharide heptosyltransferase II
MNQSDQGSIPVVNQRILIVLLGAIGDVVRGMNLVNAIKDAQPHTHITWLVEPASASIVRLHPRIDEVIVFNRRDGWRGVKELWSALRSRRFDRTLDLQRHAKSGLFSLLSRAPDRIGFHKSDGKEFNWLCNTRTIAAQGEDISKVAHYLCFLDAMNLPRPARLSSGLEGTTLEKLAPAWRAELHPRFVGVVLGSSWDSKDWPEEGYKGFVQQAHSAGVSQVVLLGDKSKVDMASRLQQVPATVAVLNLVGRTTLPEVVAVLSAAQACVGPDSGPAHICGAVGTPHVTIFGPTSVTRNAPRGSEKLAVFASVGCAPCKRRVCPGLGKLCMRLISPELVVDRLREALQVKQAEGA